MAKQFKKSFVNQYRVREKGRAGGRARRPARHLAGEPIHVSEATVANGVVSCEVIIRLSWPWSSLCSLQVNEMGIKQTQCQRSSDARNETSPVSSSPARTRRLFQDRRELRRAHR